MLVKRGLFGAKTFLLLMVTGLMGTTDDDSRVLKIIFDGQVAHRETQLDNMAKLARTASSAIQDITFDAVSAKNDRKRYDDITLGRVESQIRELRKALEAVRQADVTIGNIENLSRGRLKFFGTSALPKGPTNVTQLPRTTAIPAQAKGSTPATGPKQGADNPGRERQRQRKQAQDDK